MFRIGDKVKVHTKFHGWKPGIIIEKVDDMRGISWEVKHLQDHWTPSTIATEQDLKRVA